MSKYFVDHQHDYTSSSPMLQPACSVTLGKIDDSREGFVERDESNAYGQKYINIYDSLEDAWNDCKKSGPLHTMRFEGIAGDDKDYIANDINSNPEYYDLGLKDTPYCRKKTYDCMAKDKAACKLNDLDVDFTKFPSYDMYSAYQDRIEDGKAREEAFFGHQAEQHKNHSVMYSNDKIDEIMSPNCSSEEAFSKMDKLYQNVANAHGDNYISASDIDIKQITPSDERPMTFVKAEHNGHSYSFGIPADYSSDVKEHEAQRYFADVLNQKEAEKQKAAEQAKKEMAEQNEATTQLDNDNEYDNSVFDDNISLE